MFSAGAKWNTLQFIIAVAVTFATLEFKWSVDGNSGSSHNFLRLIWNPQFDLYLCVKYWNKSERLWARAWIKRALHSNWWDFIYSNSTREFKDTADVSTHNLNSIQSIIHAKNNVSHHHHILFDRKGVRCIKSIHRLPYHITRMCNSNYNDLTKMKNEKYKKFKIV